VRGNATRLPALRHDRRHLDVVVIGGNGKREARRIRVRPRIIVMIDGFCDSLCIGILTGATLWRFFKKIPF
jgi:hypothetical protein